MPDTETGLAARPPLVLSERDNVAVLAARAEAGSDPLELGAPLSAAVAPGHKIARREIGAGEPVVKYGQVIGYATAPIAAGEHVHSHNCEIGEHERAYRISDKLAEARAAIPRLTRLKTHAQHVEPSRRARRHPSQRFILLSHARLNQEIDERRARRGGEIQSGHGSNHLAHAVAIVEERARATTPRVRVLDVEEICLRRRGEEIRAGEGDHRADDGAIARLRN